MNAINNEQAAEILREAAGLIESKGFTQHDREGGLHGYTTDIAICQVTHGMSGPGLSYEKHTEECEEAQDRLLGWMLLNGIVRLPSWQKDAGNIIATWNDEKGREAKEAIAVLRKAAAGATLGGLPDQIKTWAAAALSLRRQYEGRLQGHVPGHVQRVSERVKGAVMSLMFLRGKPPEIFTGVGHDVYAYADVLGIDIDAIEGHAKPVRQS